MAKKRTGGLLSIPIRIDKEHDEIIGVLDAFGIFDDRNDIVFFAASVGFKLDEYAETKKHGFEGRAEQATVKNNLNKAQFLAFQKVKDKSILDDKNMSYKILCGFANGGLSILSDWYKDSETPEGFQNKILNEMYVLSTKK